MTVNFQFNRERHEFTVAGVVRPSTTQVISAAGICNYSFVAEAIRNYALARGRSVHWLLQLEDEGMLNYRRVPRALLGFRRAYMTWKSVSGFVIHDIERQFVSRYGYGGIIDRVGHFPPNAHYRSTTLAIVDFKTGAVADWVRYQLAAYALGIQPNIALARTIRRIGLSLFEDGTYKVKEYPLDSFDCDISRFIEELRRMNVNSD
jgi:hypothetical protein